MRSCQELGNPIPVEPADLHEAAIVADRACDRHRLAFDLHNCKALKANSRWSFARSARNIGRPPDWHRLCVGLHLRMSYRARPAKEDGQWTPRQRLRYICPTGHGLFPAAQVAFSSLRVAAFVNGEFKQDARSRY